MHIFIDSVKKPVEMSIYPPPRRWVHPGIPPLILFYRNVCPLKFPMEGSSGPILPWEEIEKVLVRQGLQLDTGLYEKDTLDKKVSASIQIFGTVTELGYGEGKSRQEAVMLAVIALAKENH